MYQARYFRELAARCYSLGRTCFDLDTARQLNDMGDELLSSATKLDGHEGSAHDVAAAKTARSLRRCN